MSAQGGSLARKRRGFVFIPALCSSVAMGVKLGFVGLGSFGKSFAGLFRAHPGVESVALCDREPERIAEVAGWPAFSAKHDSRDRFTDLGSLLKSGVDAVALFTQPWLHAPQAIQVMEAGKHVYSAVPVIMLPDSEEILEWCGKLVETCRKTGCHYMLGETTCYRPQAMYCLRRAKEGAFGEFVHAEGQYLHDVDNPSSNLREVNRNRSTGAAGREWAAKAACYRQRGVLGGPMHYPTHSVSGPLWVMGTRAVKVSAWGTPPPSGDGFFADSAFSNETALFRLANGATLRLAEYRKIGHPGEEMFSIYGTEGSFKGSEGPEGNHWLGREGSRELGVDEMRDPLPEDFLKAMEADGLDLGGHGGSHAYLVHEFVSAVAERRTPAINVWRAARFMAAGAVAHLSALAEGKLMDVPDWGDPPE